MDSAGRELAVPRLIGDEGAAAAEPGQGAGWWRELGRPLLSSKVAIDLLRLIDCGCVLVMGWFPFFAFASEPELDAAWPLYCLGAVLGSLLLVNVLQVIGGYGPARIRQPLAHLQDVVVAVLIVAAGLLAVGFFTDTSKAFARDWALSWILGTLAALIATRVAFHFVLQRLRPTSRSGWLRRNVAIVGAGPDALRLIDSLRMAGEPYLHVVGVYDDRAQVPPGGRLPRGRIADLCELSRRIPIDKIYVAMPWSADGELLDALTQLECLPVDVRLQLPPIGGKRLHARVSYLNDQPFINIADRPLGGWGCLLKWLEDRVIALSALVVVAPLMALIALAIKIDSPGPVLFRQPRYGFNNGLIEVFKFRTMRQDLCDPAAARLTSRNDPRVTPLGRFLRRSSLDELPQLFNVLRGEMSIVGPRPHPIEAKAANRYYHDVVAGYVARHKVKPGITGWAQVNGWRGPTDTEEQLRQRVAHDLYYLERWSLAFDLKIILMTLYRGFVGNNAY